MVILFSLWYPQTPQGFSSFSDTCNSFCKLVGAGSRLVSTGIASKDFGDLLGGHAVYELGDSLQVAVAAANKDYVGDDAILVLVKNDFCGASA
jgi:hypothetical protein